MNTQVSGLASLFSGLDGLENIQQSLQQDSVLPEQFASALLQQLDMIKQDAEGIVLPVEQTANLNQLQDFAASLGSILPGESQASDIDLEETMAALTDVLNNIEALEENDSGFSSLKEITELNVNAVKAEIDQPVNLNSAEDDGQGLAVVVLPVVNVMPESQNTINQEDVLRYDPSGQMSAEIEQSVLSVLDENVKNKPVEADIAEESILNIAENSESDGLADERPDFQDAKNQFLMTENQKNSDELEHAGLRDKDIGPEKNPSKITAELALLNRAVGREIKPELSSMTRHFAHPDWGNEFSEKVVWMHKQAIPSAELNLNPRHLGPVSIRVDVNQDQTTIAFTAQHSAVKEAIEAALPKLREMLSAQQLNLADVSVSQQQSEHKQSQGFFQMAGKQQDRGASEHADDVQEGQFQEAGVSVSEEIEAGRAIASQGILSIFA